MLNDLEKTAKGCQELFMRCSSTAPTPMSLASVVRAIGALLPGWTRWVAWHRAALVSRKAHCMGSVHVTLSFFFFLAVAWESGPISNESRGTKR